VQQIQSVGLSTPKTPPLFSFEYFTEFSFEYFTDCLTKFNRSIALLGSGCGLSGCVAAGPESIARVTLDKKGPGHR
jgi:hypothetical protein